MITSFTKLIQQANKTVVFTGAGMSTESGLPDFRSKDSGLWERFNPTELATIDALTYKRESFIKFYQYRLQTLMDVAPHAGHFVLAEWENNNIIDCIITQNVDGFHHEAGNQHVMELHGSFRQFHCHSCQKTYDRTNFSQGDTTCSCGGTIRPNIVLFGEALPGQVFRQAEKASEAADLFIVLGSSLTVSPANMFPLIGIENGAKLVIVNHDPTPYDHYAHIVIQDLSIKDTLEQVQEQLQQQ